MTWLSENTLVFGVRWGGWRGFGVVDESSWQSAWMILWKNNRSSVWSHSDLLCCFPSRKVRYWCHLTRRLTLRKPKQSFYGPLAISSNRWYTRRCTSLLTQRWLACYYYHLGKQRRSCEHTHTDRVSLYKVDEANLENSCISCPSSWCRAMQAFICSHVSGCREIQLLCHTAFSYRSDATTSWGNICIISCLTLHYEYQLLLTLSSVMCSAHGQSPHWSQQRLKTTTIRVVRVSLCRQETVLWEMLKCSIEVKGTAGGW